MAYSITKEWDGNECETEGRNGRTYVSRGRWQWVVSGDGIETRAFDTKREAVHYGDAADDAAFERELAESWQDDGTTPTRPRVLPNRDEYTRGLMPERDVDGGPIVRVYASRDAKRTR